MWSVARQAPMIQIRWQIVGIKNFDRKLFAHIFKTITWVGFWNSFYWLIFFAVNCLKILWFEKSNVLFISFRVFFVFWSSILVIFCSVFTFLKVCTHFERQDRQGGQDRNLENIKDKQTEHIVKKITQLKWLKNEETKLPKMEWTRHY